MYQWQDGCGLVPVEPLLHREKLDGRGKIMIRQKLIMKIQIFSERNFEIYRRKCSIVWCCRLFIPSNTLGNVACGSGFCVLSEVEEETDDQEKENGALINQFGMH